MEPARDYVLIYVNGTRHEVRGRRVFQPLSDFLRCELQLTGTKVVCAEGDCGSCTVLLGRPARGGGGRLDYSTVCSCIQFLYQLDAVHVVTVEGLKYDGALNPVQEAMVHAQGTQCGFCTPGFVVSLCAMFDEASRPGSRIDDDAKAACIGNLCRCTGYLPILEAAAAVDASRIRPMNELYPPGEMAADLRGQETQPVIIRHAQRLSYKPVTIEQAVAFKREHPECVLVAGGTDVGVHVNKGLRDPDVVMSLSGLRELTEVTLDRGANAIIAGARASITDLERVTRDALPEYAEILYYFGSPPIRNAGTVGGNIVNGSPIGDTMPAMFVLNAEVELAGPGEADGAPAARRRVNINDFYTGYRRSVMSPDEIVTRVLIPLPAQGELFRLYKISRRKDLDISAFTAAIWMRRGGAGGETITDARLAFGGVGPVILRLPKTEAYLRGKALTEETVREAGRIARAEITPISDVRGSAEYRSQLGENILRKFYADLTLPGANGNGNGDAGPGGNRDVVAPVDAAAIL